MSFRIRTLPALCLAAGAFALLGAASAGAQEASATVAPLPTLPPNGPPDAPAPVDAGVPPALSLPVDEPALVPTASLGLPPSDPFTGFGDPGDGSFGDVPGVTAGADGDLAGRLAQAAEQSARRSLGGAGGSTFGFASSAGLRSERDERHLREQMRELAASLQQLPEPTEPWNDPEAEWRQRGGADGAAPYWSPPDS